MEKDMKKIKAFIIAIAIWFVLSPILFYSAIVITNNCIAADVERKLIKCSLPENTQIISSISVAAKMRGNGNGMQYMGSILVRSDLSEEQLLAYYNTKIDGIEVKEQKDSYIDFIHSPLRFFDVPADMDFENCYSIIYIEYDADNYFNGAITELLDFDIRGH